MSVSVSVCVCVCVYLTPDGYTVCVRGGAARSAVQVGARPDAVHRSLLQGGEQDGRLFQPDRGSLGWRERSVSTGHVL